MQVNRATVILNASSGWDKKEDVPTKLREIFQTHGVEATIQPVRAGMDIRRIAIEAARGGAQAVIAGGGDGTIRAVASALAGTGVPMGVIPAGTLNHFARDLELPIDMTSAAEATAGGEVIAVDVAEANGHVFINNAVIGLYPAYRFERQTRQQRGWSKRLAILLGLFAMIRRYPFLKVRLVIDGQEMHKRTPYILVANNEHAMEGYKPWQRESLTEGKLWVYVLRDTSRLGLVRVLLKLITGRFKAEDEFDVLHTSELWIDTRKRHLSVSLDGEIVRMTAPVHFQSRPCDLRVIVPKDSSRIMESHCSVG